MAARMIRHSDGVASHAARGPIMAGGPFAVGRAIIAGPSWGLAMGRAIIPGPCGIIPECAVIAIQILAQDQGPAGR